MKSKIYVTAYFQHSLLSVLLLDDLVSVNYSVPTKKALLLALWYSAGINLFWH
jgi:hypothetical protein